ncbi:hypothetical protein VTK73DRAFT_3214 [Phialemonium thermophilum]|uniref:Secreted protein n=1 Tax=Phialemonium thermophilum TaxID=223376 RepID=A0ABR3VKM2_9PEZI
MEYAVWVLVLGIATSTGREGQSADHTLQAASTPSQGSIALLFGRCTSALEYLSTRWDGRFRRLPGSVAQHDEHGFHWYGCDTDRGVHPLFALSQP